ncbi:hypothetical protein ES707_15502 [subsurface metagenome]
MRTGVAIQTSNYDWDNVWSYVTTSARTTKRAYTFTGLRRTERPETFTSTTTPIL